MITLPVSVTMKAVETGDSMNPRRVNVVAVRGSLHGMDQVKYGISKVNNFNFHYTAWIR